MSTPSWATAGRTLVSISSLISAISSASAGSSSNPASGATEIAPALAGLNSGAPLEKWSRRTVRTCGFRSFHSTLGAAVTEMKSRPKKTPATSPVEKRASASGEASASSGLAKSRVPLSITRSPGRNLRVAGLGVVSVWISMAFMWPRRPGRSSRSGSVGQARLAREAAHQYRRALRLAVEADQVDRLVRRVVAVARRAEADETVDILGDEADVAGAAFQRVERAHLGQAEVAIDGVQSVEK